MYLSLLSACRFRVHMVPCAYVFVLNDEVVQALCGTYSDFFLLTCRKFRPFQIRAIFKLRTWKDSSQAGAHVKSSNITVEQSGCIDLKYEWKSSANIFL